MRVVAAAFNVRSRDRLSETRKLDVKARRNHERDSRANPPRRDLQRVLARDKVPVDMSRSWKDLRSRADREIDTLANGAVFKIAFLLCPRASILRAIKSAETF